MLPRNRSSEVIESGFLFTSTIMKKTTYSKKLLDPRWQKKRLKIMERDEFTCQSCGNKNETLQVHHFVYNGNPWDANDSDLITYCDNCHEKYTITYNSIKKELSRIRDIDTLMSVLNTVKSYNNIHVESKSIEVIPTIKEYKLSRLFEKRASTQSIKELLRKV